MNKHNEQFEQQLNQHFSERKKRHTLTPEQQALFTQMPLRTTRPIFEHLKAP